MRAVRAASKRVLSGRAATTPGICVHPPERARYNKAQPGNGSNRKRGDARSEIIRLLEHISQGRGHPERAQAILRILEKNSSTRGYSVTSRDGGIGCGVASDGAADVGAVRAFVDVVTACICGRWRLPVASSAMCAIKEPVSRHNTAHWMEKAVVDVDSRVCNGNDGVRDTDL